MNWKRYTIPAIAGLALLSGCSKLPPSTLPRTSDSVETSVTSYAQVNEQYFKAIEEVVDEFFSACADGYLSVQEQQKTYDAIQRAKSKYESLGARPEIANRTYQLESLLNLNLNDCDYGTPKLEHELRTQGHQVHVEGKLTRADFYLPSVYAGILSLFGLGIYLDERRKKKVEK